MRILALVLAILLVFFIFCMPGCDVHTSGGEYNKSAQMPQETKGMRVISAGFTTAKSDSFASNYDWVSLEDESGNIHIYRQNSKEGIWYKTVIYR